MDYTCKILLSYTVQHFFAFSQFDPRRVDTSPSLPQELCQSVPASLCASFAWSPPYRSCYRSPAEVTAAGAELTAEAHLWSGPRECGQMLGRGIPWRI